jgi:hypothetical protein
MSDGECWPARWNMRKAGVACAEKGAPVDTFLCI